jgi:hypothetical protein
MSKKDIASRNRRNAEKSTGPKTAEGKKAVSKNAVRHGATARPDPELVATWLRVIMNEPLLSFDDLEGGGDVYYRGLALAEAEVRLQTAEESLDAFEEQERERDKERKRLFRAGAIWLGGILEGYNNPTKDLVELAKFDRREFTIVKRNRSLLRRYVSEAKSQRRRAFRAWVLSTRLQ